MKKLENKVADDKKSEKFRMYSKHFFLTYPAISLIEKWDKNKIIEYFREQSCYQKAKLTYACVSLETGEKKSDSKDYQHFHVLLSFDRKIDIRDSKYWDLPEDVHGHYKAVDKKRGSFKKVLKYIKKDGDVAEWRDRALAGQLVKVDPVTAITTHLSTLSEGERSKALAQYTPEALAAYNLNKMRIDRALTQMNVSKANQAIQNNYNYQFINPLPEQMKQWVEGFKEKKVLLLLGLSGTGKTSWAKQQFKNPLIVSSLDSFKRLTDNHDGLIFDDFAFSKLSKEMQIMLMDLETERDVPVKFGNVHVKSHLPRIFTHNDDEAKYLGYVHASEIPKELKRRYICFYVDKDLRKIEEGK